MVGHRNSILFNTRSHKKKRSLKVLFLYEFLGIPRSLEGDEKVFLTYQNNKLVKNFTNHLSRPESTD